MRLFERRGGAIPDEVVARARLPHGEKALASVPAASAKRVPEIAALKSRVTALRKQGSRMRASLEDACVTGETFTTAEGRAYVFVAVDHCSGEFVGIHAASGASRWEALEPVKQGIAKHFGALDRAGVATGLTLRHDHGSNYMSGDFQREIRFLGEPLPQGDPARSLARGVGTIYQELDLVDDLTVRQTGAIAYALSGLVNERIESRQRQVRDDLLGWSKEDLDKLDPLDVAAPSAQP